MTLVERLHSEIEATPSERERRAAVLTRILECIRADTRIKLPPFDPDLSLPSEGFALQSAGLEENDFGSTLGEYRYQFEGEEDLLHLIITRYDGGELTPEEGQEVASFLLEGVPSALVWLRPGEFSQHFYIGHDELLDGLTI